MNVSKPLLLALFFVMSANAQSLPALAAADRAAIQGAISAQIKAFSDDNGVAAFQLAAPSVRRHFGSAETFMAMVKEAYEALYRNRATTFLEAAVIEGNVVQPMRIIQRDGAVVIALYNMERQANGDWRIAGCELAPSDLKAA